MRTEEVRVFVSGTSMNDFEVNARALEFPFVPSVLRGSIKEDGTMNLVRTSSPSCNGVKQPEKQYSYSGEVEIAGNEVRVRLKAREVWCPTLNCVFDMIIEFNRFYDID